MENNIYASQTLPFLVVMVLYIGFMVGIGVYAKRRTASLGDFLTMSGKAGAVLSGVAYFATQYSMSTFMGVPGTIYNVGYAGMTVSVPGIVFSMMIPALLVGRRLIRMGHKYGMLTMADYLSDRYESEGIRGLLAIIMILFLIPMMGAQTVGGGHIFKIYTGWSSDIGIIIMGATVITYCITGGIRSVMITDVVQGALMVCTAVITFLTSIKLGGGFEMIHQVLMNENPALLTQPGVGNAYPIGNYISMIVMWSFFTIGQPHLFTKFFTMRSYNVMFKGVILGTLGMLFSASLIEWSGVTGHVAVPGLAASDQVVPMILHNGVPAFISALMVAGIFSAGMSTISSLLLTSTGAVSRDLYQKILKKGEISDADTLRASRVITLVLGVLAVAMGIYSIHQPGSSIFGLVLFAFGGLAIWVAPILAGMYWKGATTMGAFAGVIVGEIVYITMKYLPASGFTKALRIGGVDPVLPSWFIALVVLIIVSQFTPKCSKATLDRHFDSLDDGPVR